MTMFFGVLLARQIGLDVGGDAAVLPLLATQILWINLVTDGPPGLALGVDPADDGLMNQPPRPPGERVITARMWSGIMFVDGSVQVVVVYVPLLQNAFGTTSLNVSNWILCIAVASSVLWLREGSKAVIRGKGSHV